MSRHFLSFPRHGPSLHCLFLFPSFPFQLPFVSLAFPLDFLSLPPVPCMSLQIPLHRHFLPPFIFSGFSCTSPPFPFVSPKFPRQSPLTTSLRCSASPCIYSSCPINFSSFPLHCNGFANRVPIKNQRFAALKEANSTQQNGSFRRFR